MSFAGTPLGQGRRLDHHTFHGKPTSSGSQNYIKPPSSYSYGAPALGSRSPPKVPSSPFRSRVQQGEEEEEGNNDGNENGNDGALSRFARLKQQQQHQNHAISTTTANSTTTTTTNRERDLSTRPGGPKVITSPPKPERWSVKDTSVNIATAFTQAASASGASSTFGDMNAASSSYTNNHNHNWASTSRTPLPVPRSTSVEYEAAAAAGGGLGSASQGTGGQPKRALPAPPDKFVRPTTTAGGVMTRKPLSKTVSIRHVPDSEGEEDQPTTTTNNGRGKSPFEHGLSFAKHALGAAAYYVRHRSREPEERSVVNGGNESYDYAAEEQAYQTQKRVGTTSTPSVTTGTAHRRNRMSVDNKAYKPSQESEDEEDDEWGGDTKRRKRRGGKGGGPAGGPLLTLPVVKADKRRRRKKGTLGSLGDGEGDSGSEDGDNTQANLISTSHGRRSQEPTQDDLDDSMISAEQGLTSIPEIDEDYLPPSSTSASVSASHQQQQQQKQQQHPRSGSTRPRSRSRSRTPAPPSLSTSGFSIGGLLGHMVHVSFKLVLWAFSGVLSCMSMFTFLFGQVFGTAFDLVLRRPVGWAASSGGMRIPIGKYALPALVLILAWYVVREGSLGDYMHILATPKRYIVPDVAPGDISELAARLLRIENALSGLSADAERMRSIRSYEELMSRLGVLEGRVGSEVRRVQDGIDARAREVVRGEVGGVRRDVEVLSAQVGAERRERERREKEKEKGEERLQVLEERLGGVEQIAKKAAAAVATATTTTPSAAWWNKIVSSGGQDVSSLIAQLVHSAMSTYAKDDLAKADYALHSGGARVIPSLTSATLELQPETLQRKLYGLIMGTGYAVGRSPVTALHHELHNGHCWPFPGQQGQLGVVLARGTVVIDEVSVDHVSKEVAFDLSSAPRDMEVWGMVEGADNLEKLKAWNPDDSIPYPSTLPSSPQFIRLANFTYDIDAPNYVQTFAVDPDVRALGLDFGIVVLRVLSNWGMDRYTCLYRFRVHGQQAEILSRFSSASEPVEDAEVQAS